MSDVEPTQGQCLVCGGRGGWWSDAFREACSRCDGTGWDPARAKPWFPIVEARHDPR
jgi:DnaJ-class molecular chaperone